MSATLRFLNEDADAEFLANPRIVTADNLQAKIEINRAQPVPQLNFNEQTATAVFGGFQDKKFGNTLIVTPSINKDNFVTLKVKPEISNKVGDSTFVFAGATVSQPDHRYPRAGVQRFDPQRRYPGDWRFDPGRSGEGAQQSAAARRRARSWLSISESSEQPAPSATCWYSSRRPLSIPNTAPVWRTRSVAYTMSERNTPTSMAGATTPRALSAWCRPATDKSLRIIRNQGHRRRRQRANPTCNSRVQPRIAISRVSVECGVERGRTLRGVRPFRLQECWPCGLCAMEHGLIVCAPSGV